MEQEIDIWGEIANTFERLFSGLLTVAEQAFTQGLPRLALAGVTLVVGWLVAVFVRKLTTKGLRGFGFDLVLERTGLRTRLQQRGVATAPSALVGWALYVLIMYSALVLAFERVDFRLGLTLLSVIAVWTPRVLVALLLVALGHWIGRWLGRVVAQAAQVAMLPAAPVARVAVHAAVLLFAVLLAVRNLELASDLLLLVGLVSLLGTLLLLAVLLAVCARDVWTGWLAGRMIRSLYQPGDRIRLDQWEGTIVALRLHMVQLQTDQGLVDIPATRFMCEPVVRLPAPN